MLELADRPEEVAGVVAHELAHVTQKHGFRKIISDAGPYLIMKIFFGGASGTAGVLGGSSQLLVRQSFSQEYELEADEVGWQYLVAARALGWDVHVILYDVTKKPAISPLAARRIAVSPALHSPYNAARSRGCDGDRQPHTPARAATAPAASASSPRSSRVAPSPPARTAFSSKPTRTPTAP